MNDDILIVVFFGVVIKLLLWQIGILRQRVTRLEDDVTHLLEIIVKDLGK